MELLLVGCGKMGGALLTGWERARVKVTVIDPAGGEYPTLAKLPAAYAPDVIVLAVKPQALDAVLPDYAARFGGSTLYISIAAGKTLAYYSEKLGADARIIRAMPNTPAVVGQGASVLVAGAQASAADRAAAEQLFQAVGKVYWVADEVQMHAVTALSGSGPAYVFLFMEALSEAAAKAGLPGDMAAQLAVQTLAGAAALAEKNSDFAALQRDVTSLGGTTEAALNILRENDALKRLIAEAMDQAIARSKALSA